MEEIYCYRVIFPNGVSVRVSPAIESARTGEILPYGSMFESNKSLVLDGVNYVKLMGNRGWVFISKGSTPVLELVEVLRIQQVPTAVITPSTPECDPIKTRVTSSSDLYGQGGSDPDETFTAKPRKNLSHLLLSPSNPKSKAQQMWKEIRSRVRLCKTFAEFSQLVLKELDPEILPPSIPEPGPARSAWMANATLDSEHLLRARISTLAGVTRQCTENISDISGLESHLWVITHLGASNIAHIIRLFDVEAQNRFESFPPTIKEEILRKVSEVGNATRTHNIMLSKEIDMISDDLRHILQRWCIIKVTYAVSSSPSNDSSPSGSPSSVDRKGKTALSQKHPKPVQNQTTMKPDLYIPAPLPSTTSALLAMLGGCNWRTPSPTGVATPGGSISPPPSFASGQFTDGKKTTLQSFMQVLGDYHNYARNLAADPDLQLANFM